MAERLLVNPADVVAAVFANWDAVSAEQINALADGSTGTLALTIVPPSGTKTRWSPTHIC